MALMLADHEQPNFKHFCKVCKKGFMCGSALGGHMRAHGGGNIEDQASDSEDKGHLPAAANKRMHVLRSTNVPNRLKSCRVCENCGKEFLSWKSFLEHGKCCCSNEAESQLSSPPQTEEYRRGCQWSKRKRSFRANVDTSCNSTCLSSEEEENAASCLMMLSNNRVEEYSCTSASKQQQEEEEEEEDRQNWILRPPNIDPLPFTAALDKAKGRFECKACKKVFNSHQALGGHRASHKKVKGCFASRLDQNIDDPDEQEESFLLSKSVGLRHNHNQSFPMAGASRGDSKVHKCSICHRIFSSGQALGGHKRCHWLTSNQPEVPTEILLRQPGVDENNNDDKNENCTSLFRNVADEGDCKGKLAKLSDLKDMEVPWLQVGIGSTAGVGAYP